jgi:hypothetical protein
MVATTGTVMAEVMMVDVGPVAEASMAVDMEVDIVELRAPFAFGATGPTSALERLSRFWPPVVVIVTREHDA